MKCGELVLLISALVAIYIGILMQRSVSNLTDQSKCPFCYGIDLCEDIEGIKLQYKTFNDFFYNLFSVKNIFFAEWKGRRVVLKKLGHDSELNLIKSDSFDQDSIVDSVSVSGISGLKTCGREVTETLVNSLRSHFEVEQISTILQINGEPLVLTLLKKGFPVPRLYGSCGFVIVEEYCGLPLNHFETSPWHVRAFLALQLLEGVIDFTLKHEDFRLYLTDVSPDNIAVDRNFKVFFVDLEHVILQRKVEDTKSFHYSEFFSDEEFIYSEEKICASSLSDHNVYAVCRLLLSRKAPWPTMANGLLHSPPQSVTARYSELFTLVEECVDSKEKLSRFDIAETLIKLLKEVNINLL